jgi:cell division protein FtsN
VLGGAVTVIIVVVFALGVVVGRKWPHHADPSQAVAEPAKKPAPVARRSGLVDPGPERPPQEKLTFYQTLTAPMDVTPPPTKVSLPAKGEATKLRPGTERTQGDRPPAALPPATAPKSDKPSGTADRPLVRFPAEARTSDWAVQVGAFKDRDQAESVRKPLAAAGFDVYLTTVTAEDGQLRYKVRLGSFKTRDEAARMADRVRQERSLTAFVTAK